MKSISRVEVIRELSRQGKIYKEICKTTQSDCRTLKNHNECDDINESPKGATQRPTKLDSYKEEIQELIDESLQNRHKQRSTA